MSFLGVVHEEIPLMTMTMADHGRHLCSRRSRNRTATTATDRASVSGRRSTVLPQSGRPPWPWPWPPPARGHGCFERVDRRRVSAMYGTCTLDKFASLSM